MGRFDTADPAGPKCSWPGCRIIARFEGTRVSVRPLGRRAARAAKPKRGPASLYERLKPVIGKARNLPADMAENHDHYLYGVPKRRAAKRRKARR